MFYMFHVENVSPMIISVKEGYRGLLYKTLTDSIPGSMIKGSILTKMMSKDLNLKEVACNESLNPETSISWAIAAPRENSIIVRDVSVSHSLCYIVKSRGDEVCSFNVGLLLEEVSKGLDVRSALKKILLSKLMKIGNKYYSENRTPLLSPVELRPAIGRVIWRSNGSWKIFSGGKATSTYIQVGLDKLRRTAAPGLLFGYEYVKPGQKYVGVASGPRIREIVEVLGSRVDVRLGRGVTRGFGSAVVEFRELGEEEFYEKVLSENVDVDNIKSGSIMALQAITPLLVEPVGILSVGGSINLPTPWMKKIIPQNTSSIKLKVMDMIAPAKPSTYRGFSLRTGMPKLKVEALSRGSLVVCRVEDVSGSREDIIELLIHLLATGLDVLSSQGFNHILPLSSDPVLGGELLNGGRL